MMMGSTGIQSFFHVHLFTHDDKCVEKIVKAAVVVITRINWQRKAIAIAGAGKIHKKSIDTIECHSIDFGRL